MPVPHSVDICRCILLFLCTLDDTVEKGMEQPRIRLECLVKHGSEVRGQKNTLLLRAMQPTPI